MRLSDWMTLAPLALGAGAFALTSLLVSTAPVHAAACGQPPTGESAGSVSVEQFIGRVTAQHSGVERIELATFGLG